MVVPNQILVSLRSLFPAVSVLLEYREPEICCFLLCNSVAVTPLIFKPSKGTVIT